MRDPQGKLLLVLSCVFSVRGGIPRFNQMLCLALDRIAVDTGLDVRVVSQDDSDEDYRRAGSPWKRVRFIAGGGKYGALRRGVVEAFRQRPDAMIVGLLGMTPAGLISRPVLRRGYAFLAHGFEVWRDHPLCDRRRSRLFAARRATRAFAVSRYTADELAALSGMPRERIDLLPNTLEPHFESFEAPTKTAAAGPPELLTVSRLWPQETMKGVDHAIRAFARLGQRHPAATFRVVGKGDDKPRLEALARSEGVAERVVFEQDLSDEALADRYRDCRAFVLPSGQEGFGIVFLEAMRFSKPCIGGRHGGTPEVIDDGTTGLLVRFGDVDQLEQAMDLLLGDEARAAAMGRAGRQRLLDRFTFERFHETVRGHVETLLAGS